jgi:hypothetical protein
MDEAPTSIDLALPYGAAWAWLGSVLRAGADADYTGAAHQQRAEMS